MAEKQILSRIIQKHDIEANWNKAANFVPMRGELIVYDIDANYDYERLKIGDGATSVVDLPFTGGVDSWNDLKDRPFYEENNQVTVLDTTLTFVRNADDEMGEFWGYSGCDVDANEWAGYFTPGDVITVVWDETTYTDLETTEGKGMVAWVRPDNLPFERIDLPTNGCEEYYSNYFHFYLNNPVDTGANINVSVKLIVDKSTVTKIDPKYLPIETPDWSVNDETNPAYVKNRTHYYREETYIIKPTTITFTVIGYDDMGEPIGFNNAYLDGVDCPINYKIGDKVNVFLNGTIYPDCEIVQHKWYFRIDVPIVGAAIYLPDGVNKTDVSIYGGSLTENADSDVSVEAYVQIPEGYVTIPHEYLPTIQPDWEQTDDTQKDFIKNKPFGVSEVIHYETDGKAYAEPVFTLISDVVPTANDLVGAHFYITGLAGWNGDLDWYVNETEITKETWGVSAVCSGNFNSRLPFTVRIIDNAPVEIDETLYSSNGIYLGKHCVGFEGTYGTIPVFKTPNADITLIDTIDEKFIPSTIARTADIPDIVVNPTTATIGQTIVVKAVDENGKPTEWEAVDLPSGDGNALYYSEETNVSGIAVVTIQKGEVAGEWLSLSGTPHVGDLVISATGQLFKVSEVNEDSLYMGYIMDLKTALPENIVQTINGQTPDENGNVEINVPEGFSGSWNDLTDKPFEEILTGGDTLVWNGNVDGLVTFEDTEQGYTWYKVSNSTPTVEQLDTSSVRFSRGEDGVVLLDGENDIWITDTEDPRCSEFNSGDDILIFVIREAGYYGAPEAGIYFANNGEGYYTHSVTIPGYTDFPSIKTIDEKFIPDTIARIDDIGAPTDEQVTDAVNEYLDANPVSGLSTTASNLLIEILRGGVYSTDQSANIDALAAELGVTEEDPEVTLSSISATYSGGDVTTGTAVTDLTGIVVTAHYSDGTSETVTGYTLSGEIAEGSNTITVSYGGKTTTFTVTGVAESADNLISSAVVTFESTGHNYYKGQRYFDQENYTTYVIPIEPGTYRLSAYGAGQYAHPAIGGNYTLNQLANLTPIDDTGNNLQNVYGVNTGYYNTLKKDSYVDVGTVQPTSTGAYNSVKESDGTYTKSVDITYDTAGWVLLTVSTLNVTSWTFEKVVV